jgi:hypothetical protein
MYSLLFRYFRKREGCYHNFGNSALSPVFSPLCINFYFQLFPPLFQCLISPLSLHVFFSHGNYIICVVRVYFYSKISSTSFSYCVLFSLDMFLSFITFRSVQISFLVLIYSHFVFSPFPIKSHTSIFSVCTLFSCPILFLFLTFGSVILYVISEFLVALFNLFLYVVTGKLQFILLV